jgi:hypothetical protein
MKDMIDTGKQVLDSWHQGMRPWRGPLLVRAVSSRATSPGLPGPPLGQRSGPSVVHDLLM